jgi:hypothetical protein
MMNNQGVEAVRNLFGFGYMCNVFPSLQRLQM